MTVDSVKCLSNDALRHGLRELVAHDRTTTVRLLIHVGEFDARGLYREEGYSCMRDYCLNELGMSEDIAYKRIWAARKARRFPRILVSLHQGSLTLSAVAMLSRHLRYDNAEELLAAAAGKTNAQVAELIAQNFPQPDLPPVVHSCTGSPTRFPETVPIEAFGCPAEMSPPDCQTLAVRQVEAPHPRVSPLAPQRHGVQFTIAQSDLDLLRRAQDLNPAMDIGQVFVQALREFVSRLEKRRYGATDTPRRANPGTNPRYVAAHVRRAVRTRDQDRCTFVSADGNRCESRRFLEFDHVIPLGRGGESTTGNLRLRCRAHNQLAAEQIYGAAFMEARRREAQREAAKRRAEEVIPWLRALGIRADHAREAAARCEDMPDASLQDRVKAALRCFAPRDVRLARATPVP